MRLAAGERAAVPDAARAYVHVVAGEVALGGEHLGPGDSARVTGAEGLELCAGSAAQVLIWELAD